MNGQYGQPGNYGMYSNDLRGGDGAHYVRQQQGHSIIKHVLLGWVALYIPTIYYALSPNHYFHM